MYHGLDQFGQFLLRPAAVNAKGSLLLSDFVLQGDRVKAIDSSSFLAILTLFKTLPRVPVFVVIVAPSITVGGFHAKVKQIITPLKYQVWSNLPS